MTVSRAIGTVQKTVIGDFVGHRNCMGKKLEKDVEPFQEVLDEVWEIKRDVKWVKKGKKCDTHCLAACEAA